MANTLLRQAIYATIDGIPTRVYAGDGQHGVDQARGTCTLDLPAPMAEHIDINAPVTVQGGYRDGTIRTLFSGRLTATGETVGDRSARVRIDAEGWCSLLDWEQETDLVFDGPILLYEIVRSLCAWRGVPVYLIDRITAPDGVTDIALGGVPDYQDGKVIIPRRSSPLQWLRRTLGLFGYRIFDRPDGTVRVQRVSGMASGTPAATYTTGVNVYRLQRDRDVRTMTTYITVEGPRWTDSDGVTVVPRSIAASIPESPYLLPPGYRAGDVKDDAIVTDALAAIVRNVAEIDGGAPTVNQRWETRGDAERQPGEVVTIASPLLGTDEDVWLMATRWRIDERSYTTAMESWAGGGVALPAGIDTETVDVQIAARHIGDEYVGWYAQPNPQDTSVEVTISVPDTYTSIFVTGRIHGSNSMFIDNANADLTVSKIEVYQDQGQDDPSKPVGSVDLPVMNENYAQQLDYTNDAHWDDLRRPVPGRLETGTARVRFVAGENKSLGSSPNRFDDYELKNVVLTLTGVGTPVLPGQGGP